MAALYLPSTRRIYVYEVTLGAAFTPTPRVSSIHTGGGSLVFKQFFIAAVTLSALLSFFPQKAWTASSTVIDVQAVVLSTSNCRFRPPRSATVDFGTLNPLTGGDVTIITSLTIRCGGSAPLATFSITDDDGLNETGPDANRMQHSVVLTEFMPYTLTLSPTSATIPKNTDQIITITADLLIADYQNAIAGLFIDTVTVNILP